MREQTKSVLWTAHFRFGYFFYFLLFFIFPKKAKYKYKDSEKNRNQMYSSGEPIWHFSSIFSTDIHPGFVIENRQSILKLTKSINDTSVENPIALNAFFFNHFPKNTIVVFPSKISGWFSVLIKKKKTWYRPNLTDIPISVYADTHSQCFCFHWTPTQSLKSEIR